MVYINDFSEVGREDVATAGGKGAGLGELVRAGAPVPPGFLINTGAYELFVRDNQLAGRIQEYAALPAAATSRDYEEASGQIRALFVAGTMPEAVAAETRDAYRRLGSVAGTGPGPGTETAVAVRSSATAEDLASASFAGQQDTYLNVRGAEALLDAVINCWGSLWTSRAMAYRAREGIRPDQVRLAVVVQHMVAADAAGVMFTANPASGRRDQIVLAAAWGLGESVVSGAVSTDDVVVEAATGKVVSRRTADKAVMTAYADRGTREEPVPESRRHQPVLDDAAAATLAGYGTRIARHFGSPQDIEWARAGGEFFILQSRPITALPEPAGETPRDWSVPYPKGMYFRASIVEQLPDPLSPLFADLIDGSVSRSLNALMDQAFGKSSLRDGDLGLPAINGYAYYYYRTAALWRLMGKTPAAVRALIRGEAHMGVKGWRDYSHPRYVYVVESWSAKPVTDLTGEELLEGVSALLDAGTVYYTAVQSIIPVATSSELAFQKFYDKFVRQDGDPPAATFLLGYESEPIRAEKSLFDLAGWSRGIPGLAEAILATPTESLARAQLSGTLPNGMDQSLWQQWEHRFQLHLDRFGHTVYNLDFINPVPADDPSPLLDTLKFYLRGQGNDPHRRQELAAARREDATAKVLARLHPARRAAFTRLLRWAQDPAPIREDALADVGLGWPLMRRMLRELGERLLAAGLIADSSDVFWLRHQEISSAVEFGLAAPNGPAAITGAGRPVLAEAVAERQLRWRGQRNATAPQMLPEIRWLQRALAGMMPEGSQDQQGNTIKGVGASQGRVSAPARVLSGPEDFYRMQPGEVLVARITTPAWTPLFAMASAVVTDVGGPLSHGSIVAREYGIPAVLGTGVATRRIASGQRVEVDGAAGTVTILQSGRD
ncbi:pyruvate,water dikinase [Arthrobacter sp. PvP102]|uniref:PEP/pyruvate-binding domain-containing protein n=1 Tax=unclassified Arthrobacter TaxID=235627 RepID=UPI001AE4139A|nr:MULTISPECIES: PEP/pyruvate-binding domain-containing protein [unclassified Arthrobacter]MBP1232166.1 pyruvate,water dikinase [Arthrobacter sp. PvP103]MBP1237301.1 pyruvate,water dikinase [Arthrobacter sp. PvP102]